MIKIRKSMFETNSSSTHAMIIPKYGINNIIFPNDNFVKFKLSNFGWENEIYNDTETKASYLYTAMVLLLSKEELDDRIDMIKRELSKYAINAEFEEYNEDDIITKYYIDHCGDLIYFINNIFEYKLIISYLFCPNSIIITGNDNNDVFDEDFNKVVKEYIDRGIDIYNFYKGN